MISNQHNNPQAYLCGQSNQFCFVTMAFKKYFLLPIIILFSLPVTGQKKEKKPWFYGMYLQWGYNTETYSKSNIHFKLSNGSNFTLYSVRAHDSPDMDAISKKPLEISIPQYNYRIGFYLNKQKTKSIEINFDHMKYIVTDFQYVHVSGTIDGKPADGDSILNPATFLHLEHTDGANLLHINYVQHQVLLSSKTTGRKLLTAVYKAGAGINIPRTDFTWKGERLNNDFHIAGYNISAEGGLRYYPLKKLFIEATGKTGFVQYLNALANTEKMTGNRVSHNFLYGELIGTIGFDINF